MPLSRSIRNILEQAAGMSLTDDAALELLGRHLLSALVHGPETPETLKKAAARLLNTSAAGLSPSEGDKAEDEPD
jgi:hypothetical protein